MALDGSHTLVRDVLDPLTGERRDLALDTRTPGSTTGVHREVDGSSWWVLPAVVDADAHMPYVPFGLRESDRLRALSGGVNHLVVALPYQLAVQHSLPQLIKQLAQQILPAMTPVLSVSPTAESDHFPQWLSANLGYVRELLPGIVKLYTGDPNFERNLDAVWDCGLKPAVFAFTPDDFDRLIQRAHAPLHVRHVTSRAMVDAVRTVAGATCQTSPHMLLPLDPTHRQSLTVMPTPPSDDERTTLVDAVNAVDVIASDHVAPPVTAPTGPGLQTQQHFVPSLLTCAETLGLDLATLWHKVTSAATTTFGLSAATGIIVVDPAINVVGLWPGQTEDRAPYLGRRLSGRVLAVTSGEKAVLV